MNILSNIKSVYRKFKRTCQFLPIIWKGYDFDYHYSIELFEYQLSRTAKFLNSDATYSVDSKHNAQRLNMILRLMKKVYDEDYIFEPSNKLREEYGAWNMIWEPSENGTYTLKEFRWEKAVNDSHNESINKVYSALIKQGELKHERAHELLWKLIAHNIRNFWD